ncbi:MAG: hypothetical protein ABIH08_02125 [Candidatus Omnitrophota bacterium]
MSKLNNKKAARPLREDVDENLYEISLNSLRARQPKVFAKKKISDEYNRIEKYEQAVEGYEKRD